MGTLMSQIWPIRLSDHAKGDRDVSPSQVLVSTVRDSFRFGRAFGPVGFSCSFDPREVQGRLYDQLRLRHGL